MVATRPPWKQDTPAKGKHRKLTPAAKRTAAARAKKAGRPYPNLVDNMAVAAKLRRKSPAKKASKAKKAKTAKTKPTSSKK